MRVTQILDFYGAINFEPIEDDGQHCDFCAVAGQEETAHWETQFGVEGFGSNLFRQPRPLRLCQDCFSYQHELILKRVRGLEPQKILAFLDETVSSGKIRRSSNPGDIVRLHPDVIRQVRAIME